MLQGGVGYRSGSILHRPDHADRHGHTRRDQSQTSSEMKAVGVFRVIARSLPRWSPTHATARRFLRTRNRPDLADREPELRCFPQDRLSVHFNPRSSLSAFVLSHGKPRSRWTSTGRRHRLFAVKGEFGIKDRVAVPTCAPFSAHNPMCGDVQCALTVAEFSFFSTSKGQYEIGSISIGQHNRY